MDNIHVITDALRKCDKKCSKCGWRDKFSGKCTLLPSAAIYINLLEKHNAMKMTYCQDCVYCKVTKATYALDRDKYECKNRDGLPTVPDVGPMDFCSRGMSRKQVEVEK